MRMIDLLASIGAIQLRDARDAQVIADAIRVIAELQQDNESLRRVVESLQVELAVAKVGP